MKYLAHAVVGDRTIPVNIRYGKRNPFSLYFTFVDVHPVTWQLDREMVRDGLSFVAGEGDVRITPGGMTVGFHLSSPHGDSIAVFQRDDIVEALRQSAKTVPFGHEADLLDWSGIPRPEVSK